MGIRERWWWLKRLLTQDKLLTSVSDFIPLYPREGEQHFALMFSSFQLPLSRIERGLIS